MLILQTTALAVASLAGVQTMSAKIDDAKTAATPAAYTQEIERWRADRLKRLKAPDGWLTLVGLHWLKDGKNTVGSAKGSDVRLAKAPATLGVITLAEGKATIELDAKSGATIDGKAEKSAVLVDDAQPKPTKVTFGTTTFYHVERGGKHGLRVKDSDAATRKAFTKLDYFPVDPAWRIEATWTAFTPAHTLEVPNVVGTVDKMTVPGKASFTVDGKSYELLPVLETADAKELFFIFADKTSGKETYGAARFFYAEMPKDGKVVLDFNKAYNPPCAFTEFATCPLAPPENRLGIAVKAGEKKYRGTHP